MGLAGHGHLYQRWPSPPARFGGISIRLVAQAAHLPAIAVSESSLLLTVTHQLLPWPAAQGLCSSWPSSSTSCPVRYAFVNILENAHAATVANAAGLVPCTSATRGALHHMDACMLPCHDAWPTPALSCLHTCCLVRIPNQRPCPGCRLLS